MGVDQDDPGCERRRRALPRHCLPNQEQQRRSKALGTRYGFGARRYFHYICVSTPSPNRVTCTHGLFSDPLCIRPGLNVAKGVGVAGRIATKAGMIVAAGAAQGGVEYGIDKGRQDIDGEITFDTPLEEVRKVTSYIPGANLLFDAGRAAAGEDVDAAEIVQGAMTTAAWTV